MVRTLDGLAKNEIASDASPGDLSPQSVGMLSYSYLCGAGSSAGTRLVEIPENRLKSLLAVLLYFVEVDEDWYLATNSDVADAVKSGKLASGRAHYQSSGFFEDRWPFRIEVDQSWYETEYPDVQKAIRRGSVDSCQDHFNRYGFREGRLPSAGWSLLSARSSDV